MHSNNIVLLARIFIEHKRVMPDYSKILVLKSGNYIIIISIIIMYYSSSYFYHKYSLLCRPEKLDRKLLHDVLTRSAGHILEFLIVFNYTVFF